MDNLEQPEKIDPPIGIAGFTCLICFALTWWLASSASRHFNIAWIVWPLSIVSSLTVTFFILYRSAWLRELQPFTRVLSMLLSSAIIFAVVFSIAGLLFIGVCIAINMHFVSG